MTADPDGSLEYLRITNHPAKPGGFYLPCSVQGKFVRALLDTGATCSVVSSDIVPPEHIYRDEAVPIKVASGEVVFCVGRADVVVGLGTQKVTRRCFVMDTDAFKLVLGMDFIRAEVNGILLNPDRLIVGGETFPMTLCAEYESLFFRMFKTESYQLKPQYKDAAILELSITPSELGPECKPVLSPNPDLQGDPFIVSKCEVDLFASVKNKNEALFCSTQNSAWGYDWKSLGLTWANPPFSKMEQVLTKVAMEKCDMILVTPIWSGSSEDQEWNTLLSKLTVRQVPLPDLPLYIPERATLPLPKPRWSSMVTFVSGRLREVPREALNPNLVKKVLKANNGYDKVHLKQWNETHVPRLRAEITPAAPVQVETPSIDSFLWEPTSDLPCSSIASEDSILGSPLVTDASFLNFYVDLLWEEVEHEHSLANFEEVVQYMKGGDEPCTQSKCFKPKDPYPLSTRDMRELRDKLEHRINYLEHCVLMDRLRKTWGPHADGCYSQHDDDDFVFLSYDLEGGGVEQLSYADLEDYEQVFNANSHCEIPKGEYGESNTQASKPFSETLEAFDPSLHPILRKFEHTAFGPIPEPHSVPKLVELDLELKPEFASSVIKSKPYPATHADSEEIERQVQEGVNSGLIAEYTGGEYPKHCSPCYLVDKPGSNARRLVVVYCKTNKMTKNHPGSMPNMENTCERMAKCRYKSKMDARSGFWQVAVSKRAQELLAFVTPKGRVYKWLVMPFGVSNAPAVFQELMQKVLSLVRQRPRAREVLKRGGEMEVHIDDVMLGTDTEEDHRILLEEFLLTCQETNMRIRLDKCDLLKEEITYLGFEMGWGWWRPNPAKLAPLLTTQISPQATQGLKDLRSFVGAANFYRRHVRNFTYSSACLTDLTKKNATWKWGDDEKLAFENLKQKIAACTLLGVPRAEGEIVLVTDASNVGGGGSLYQWQKLTHDEISAIEREYATIGVTPQGLLKHNYPEGEWLLVPLGHWNWKWNPARSNYSTYEQELLAGVLTLASQHRLVGSNPILWLCDQESLSSFLKPTSPPPESKKVRRWWVFLTQFRLLIKHLPGIKNELCDFISRNNFDTRLGAKSEELAKDAFQRMDIHLDLSMQHGTNNIFDTWKWWDYAEEYPQLKALKDTEFAFDEKAMFTRQGSLLLREGVMVVPRQHLERTLGWLHKMNGHPGAEKLLYYFIQKFYSPLPAAQVLQVIRNLPPCVSCLLSKQNTQSDRSLQGALHIPQLVNTTVYIDFTEVDSYDRHDYILVITDGLTRFCRAFPCTRHITGEEALLIFFRDWVEVYGLPTRVHSDNDVRFTSESGWWISVLKALGCKATFGIPYRPQSNALAERQNRALKTVLRLNMTQQKSANWLRLLPLSVWMLNNQYIAALDSTPGELFLGRPYWRLFDPELCPTQANPTVRSWLLEQVQVSEKAKVMLNKYRWKALERKGNTKVKTPYKVGELVLVHKNRFPKWKRKKLASPWWGPYRVTAVKPNSVYVFVSPKLGGVIRVGTASHLKRYPVTEERFDDLWAEVADEYAAFEDELAGAGPEAVPLSDEYPQPKLSVEAIIKSEYKHGWRFLTKYHGFPVADSTWESIDSFIVGPRELHPVFERFCEGQNLRGPLEQARRRALAIQVK